MEGSRPGRHWRRWNRALHRDLGYLCLGLTVVYALSGVALNHIADWNPNYRLSRTRLAAPELRNLDRGAAVERALAASGVAAPVKNTFWSSPDTLEIFFEGGALTVDLAGGVIHRELSEERPLLFPMNYLHLNHPKRLWTYVADAYAVALAALALSGVLIARGRRGLRGRGGWLALAGLLLPLLFFVAYH